MTDTRDNTESQSNAGQPEPEIRTSPGEDKDGFSRVLDIPLMVSVELGRANILIGDLLQLAQGSVVELTKVAGEPLDVFVHGKLVARGEAVVINDQFGVRLTDIVSPNERIKSLGD